MNERNKASKRTRIEIDCESVVNSSELNKFFYGCVWFLRIPFPISSFMMPLFALLPVVYSTCHCVNMVYLLLIHLVTTILLLLIFRLPLLISFLFLSFCVYFIHSYESTHPCTPFALCSVHHPITLIWQPFSRAIVKYAQRRIMFTSH